MNGTYSEFVKCLLREDVPHVMWEFTTLEKVHAYTGFSTVPKTGPSRTRIVLTQAPTNYAVPDGRNRASHGPYGGEAISSMIVPSDLLLFVSFDENTF